MKLILCQSTRDVPFVIGMTVPWNVKKKKTSLFNDAGVAFTGEYPICPLTRQAQTHVSDSYLIYLYIWIRPETDLWISESTRFFFLLTWSWLISDLCYMGGKKKIRNGSLEPWSVNGAYGEQCASEGIHALFIAFNISANFSYWADNDNIKINISADSDMVADTSCIPNIDPNESILNQTESISELNCKLMNRNLIMKFMSILLRPIDDFWGGQKTWRRLVYWSWIIDKSLLFNRENYWLLDD